ncbi:MAG: polymer-forming cytoskeletal protein [Spirochaetes bacterium]|nr:polymer-forming cytoskeletal protein [Spirochaetota bacterium]
MVQKKQADYIINSIIGPNTSLNGDIDTGGFTRVDGSIRGNVSAKGRVIVGERARMKGDLSGTAITVGGVVFGNIIAEESLVLLSTGLVLGDIITRRIQVDDGSIIHGRISVCHDEESWVKTLTEHHDAQGIKSKLPVFAKNQLQ